MSSIDSGEFGSGFAAGAVSSLISSGAQQLGNIRTKSVVEVSKVGANDKFLSNLFKYTKRDLFKAIQIASGGFAGGAASTIAGGKFWPGARQGLITSGLNHGLHSLVGPQKYTFEKGSETSINVFEVAYISIDAIGGGLSLGKIEIYTTKYDSKIPEGLRGQKVATDLGVTGEFTVNPDTVPSDGKIKPGASLFLGMRGKITFNVTKSGYNLIDFFKDTTTIMSQKTGAAVHVGQLKGYDSSNNLIWSSTTKGGGLSVDIFTRSVFNTEFKQIKY